MRRTAGAASFIEEGYGSNASRVFSSLVQDARYEHGSGGYTGTIAEKDGFVMATREVMSYNRAYEYAEEHQDDYGKWGDAGCVAFGEEKVLVEKEFEVTIKARNRAEAERLVREKMMGGKKRAGAVVEVLIPYGGVTQTSQAGARKLMTDRSNGEVYFMAKIGSMRIGSIFNTKKEAVAFLRKHLETSRNVSPGEVVRIVKVQDQGGLSYVESSKLPTFTVTGKRVQKKVSNKVRGFIFFGWASS